MNIFKSQLKEYAFRERFLYPKLEDFQLNTNYAFTISKESTTRSIHETVQEYEDIFTLLRGCNTIFTLRPELSTKSINLHYHGTLMFPTTTSLYKFYWSTIKLLKELCTFTILPISQEEPWQWYLYTIKQRWIMKPFFHSNNIQYKITQLPLPIFILQTPTKLKTLRKR